ncbi:MAG TPA: VWA domain-containing protein, partial [Polyangiaceae bacterium]
STFDKEKVAVTFKGAATQTPLTYDATCAGANTWHYDDVVNPTLIRLCPSTCQQLQNEASAALNVEFTCEPRIVIPR